MFLFLDLFIEKALRLGAADLCFEPCAWSAYQWDRILETWTLDQQHQHGSETDSKWIPKTSKMELQPFKIELKLGQDGPGHTKIFAKTFTFETSKGLVGLLGASGGHPKIDLKFSSFGNRFWIEVCLILGRKMGTSWQQHRSKNRYQHPKAIFEKSCSPCSGGLIFLDSGVEVGSKNRR